MDSCTSLARTTQRRQDDDILVISLPKSLQDRLCGKRPREVNGGLPSGPPDGFQAEKVLKQVLNRTMLGCAQCREKFLGSPETRGHRKELLLKLTRQLVEIHCARIGSDLSSCDNRQSLQCFSYGCLEQMDDEGSLPCMAADNGFFEENDGAVPALCAEEQCIMREWTTSWGEYISKCWVGDTVFSNVSMWKVLQGMARYSTSCLPASGTTAHEYFVHSVLAWSRASKAPGHLRLVSEGLSFSMDREARGFPDVIAIMSLAELHLMYGRDVSILRSLASAPPVLEHWSQPVHDYIDRTSITTKVPALHMICRHFIHRHECAFSTEAKYWKLAEDDLEWLNVAREIVQSGMYGNERDLKIRGYPAKETRMWRERVFRVGTRYLCLKQGVEFEPVNVGAVIWEAAEVLTETMESGSIRTGIDSLGDIAISQKRVLELGCGPGLAGLSASLHGASSVLLTDLELELPDGPTILDLARQNIVKNGLCGQVSTQALEWGCSSSQGVRADVVLGADLLYAPEVYPALLQTLQDLIVGNGGSKCVAILTFKIRGHERKFFELLNSERYSTKLQWQRVAPSIHASLRDERNVHMVCISRAALL